MENETNANDPLIQLLQAKGNDLWYPSESVEPISFFHWDKETFPAADPVHLLKHLGLSEHTKVHKKTSKDFFERVTKIEDWYEEDEKAKTRQFADLQSLIESKLKHIHVFYLGEIDIEVYLIGQTENDDFAGIKTKIVQT